MPERAALRRIDSIDATAVAQGRTVDDVRVAEWARAMRRCPGRVRRFESPAGAPKDGNRADQRFCTGSLVVESRFELIPLVEAGSRNP